MVPSRWPGAVQYPTRDRAGTLSSKVFICTPWSQRAERTICVFCGASCCCVMMTGPHETFCVHLSHTHPFFYFHFHIEIFMDINGFTTSKLTFILKWSTQFLLNYVQCHWLFAGSIFNINLCYLYWSLSVWIRSNYPPVAFLKDICVCILGLSRCGEVADSADDAQWSK